MAAVEDFPLSGGGSGGGKAVAAAAKAEALRSEFGLLTSALRAEEAQVASLSEELEAMVKRRAEAERAAAANAREQENLAEQLRLEVWARQEADDRAAEAERRAAEAEAARQRVEECLGGALRQQDLAGGVAGQLAGAHNRRTDTLLGLPKADGHDAPLSPPTPPVVRA
ncbi:hypothetical protein ABPG75_013192 [Micractinium tetrahymenae]